MRDCNHDLAGVGQRKQSGSKVRRFSDCEAGISTGFGRIFPHDHWTGRESDADRNWSGRRHRLDSFKDVERGADSAFCGILEATGQPK